MTAAGFMIMFVGFGSAKMVLKGVEWWPIKLVGRTEMFDVGRVEVLE